MPKLSNISLKKLSFSFPQVFFTSFSKNRSMLSSCITNMSFAVENSLLRQSCQTNFFSGCPHILIHYFGIHLDHSHPYPFRNFRLPLLLSCPWLWVIWPFSVDKQRLTVAISTQNHWWTTLDRLFRRISVSCFTGSFYFPPFISCFPCTVSYFHDLVCGFAGFLSLRHLIRVLSFQGILFALPLGGFKDRTFGK